MGRSKQTLAWGSGTMLSCVARTSIDTGCKPIVVVLGDDVAAARAALVREPVAIVENVEWATGIGSSIRAGVGAALTHDPELSGLVILLSDQPFVTPAAIIAMLAVFARGGPDIVAARYAGTRGVPAVFGRRTFGELTALHPGAGAKRLIESARYLVAEVDVAEAAIDIDTPSEYAERRSRRWCI
jgi:molybdenum cofactor cytidylyltransferase